MRVSFRLRTARSDELATMGGAMRETIFAAVGLYAVVATAWLTLIDDVAAPSTDPSGAA